MAFFNHSRKAIDRVNSPLVFCHNDLQCGNILLREDADSLDSVDDAIVIIDYEFCSYNYRAFDIANHFCEWMFDYDHKAWPFYHCEPDKFPSKEKQVTILKLLKLLILLTLMLLASSSDLLCLRNEKKTISDLSTSLCLAVTWAPMGVGLVGWSKCINAA